MMDEGNKILRRVLKTAGAPELLQTLTGRLSLTDLQSLLLEVYRVRASERAPKELVRQYVNNRFVRPSAVSPVDSARLDELAFSLLPPGFEAIELSPVGPLGSCSVLGPVSQNNVVTTIRNTEVCADGTNMLALECAARRMERESESETIRLCASQRLVRAQQFDGPASFPHFRVLHLCSAARDRGNYRFQTEAVKEHVRYYTRLFQESRRLGIRVAKIRARVMPFSEEVLAHLQANGIEELGSEEEGVALEIERAPASEIGYYSGLRFQIHASDESGAEFFIVDGGLTRWMERLTSNRKECLLASGMGTERFLYCFQQLREA